MLKKKPRQTTVRKRIFYTNTLMILAVIAICAGAGAACFKIYWEHEEKVFQETLGSRLAGKAAEDVIEQITVHNNRFLMMAIIFVILSIVILILVSRFSTVILAKKIMEPLDLLEQGAQRIQNNDYTVPISYKGDKEFEQVCTAFNDMQQHLAEEKEKNARYEKARQEMIAGISHDLRSPLTAVRGSVKAVLDGVVTDPEQKKKFLEAAYRRSGDMDVLLSELFYFSKLETGGIPVRMQSLDLADYLRNYFHAKQDLPEYAEIEFVLDIPEEKMPPVQADPDALQRILDNLLSNSRKYANVEPLRIFAGLERTEGTQKVIVQDNGTGVPAEKLGRIFDEFYRVDESRSRKEGSGLGLYIVKYLCEAMGGQASADTESHHAGFAGLAVRLTLKEGEAADDGEGQNSDC
jgi:signal transduction histidine kinase